MKSNWFSSCIPKSKQGQRPTSPGPAQVDSHPDHGKPPSRQGFQPKGAGLQRSDSLPTPLPSRLPNRAEVKPVRHPISRPRPDANPPVHFGSKGRTLQGSLEKSLALKNCTDDYAHLGSLAERDPEYMDIIGSRHPEYGSYTPAEKNRALSPLFHHPRFLADVAQVRNEVNAIPNCATATRTMDPGEQRFLGKAFWRLKDEFARHPFRIHGETAIVGNRKGVINQINYSSAAETSAIIHKGDKYHLHTHPPFFEPFASSASEQDHRMAAEAYGFENTKLGCYVTNGKDVLHIQPDSTELVKLAPDPEMERKLGKFPVAFELPKPREAPYPFSNHEAPAVFKQWDRNR